MIETRGVKAWKLFLFKEKISLKVQQDIISNITKLAFIVPSMDAWGRIKFQIRITRIEFGVNGGNNRLRQKNIWMLPKSKSESIGSPQEKNEWIFEIKINQQIEVLVFKLQSNEFKN